MCDRGSLEWLLSFTEPNGECLEWTRCLNTDGYPRRGCGNNHNIKVHREVFELCNDFLPEVVRHSCDNPKCINPKHLLAGNPMLNMVDRQKRGRTHNFVSEDEVSRVKNHLNSGLTQREVAEMLGVKLKRIQYIVQRRT